MGDKPVNIELHYGGKFEWSPTLEYVGGWVEKVLNVDPDYLSLGQIMKLHHELYNEKMGEDSSRVTEFWYKRPTESTLEEGLRPLENDCDMIFMFNSFFVSLNIGLPLVIYAEVVGSALLAVSPKGRVLAEARVTDCARDQNVIYLTETGEIYDQGATIDDSGEQQGDDEDKSQDGDNEDKSQDGDDDADTVTSDPPEWAEDEIPDETYDDIFKDPEIETENTVEGQSDKRVEAEDARVEEQDENVQTEDVGVDEENENATVDPEPTVCEETVTGSFNHRGETEWFSDVESDDSIGELQNSDDEDNGPKFKWFHERDMDNPKLEVGLMFKSAQQFRRALVKWNLKGGYDIQYKRNENSQITSVCVHAPPDQQPRKKRKREMEKARQQVGGQSQAGASVSNASTNVTQSPASFCHWRIHASPFPGVGFQIKTFNNNHTCGRKYKNHLADSRFVASEYLDQLRDNPKWNVASMRKTVRREKMVEVSKWTIYRAKKKAIEAILGDVEDQYRKIREYANTVLHYNPGSTVRIGTQQTGVEGELRFQRVYMCLGALKAGFLAGCRPIIGLDGCHLKTVFGGILITAVGRDGNDNIYLIALAVVEAECKDSWAWFLELLMDDIGSVEDKGWVFISDRQKGLVQVFNERYPNVEHRFCLRHMYANFKARFGADTYLRELFWRAASTGNVKEWECFMKEIDRASPRQPGQPGQPPQENAYDWLKKIPPQQWTRSHFSTHAVCAVLVNNLSESFNSYIGEARDKPVVSLLEFIRRKFMERITVKKEGMERHGSDIAPHIDKRIERLKVASRNCFPMYGGDQKWEVEEFGSTYEVNVANKSCTCRMWDLSGIPCKHAMSCIDLDRSQLVKHVHPCYQKKAYLDVYSFHINPVPSPPNWMPSQLPPLLPPLVRKQTGRPRKERKRAADEPRKDQTKANKQGLPMTCKKCFQRGHNVRTCKNTVHPKSKYFSMASTSGSQASGTSEQIPPYASQQSQVSRNASHGNQMGGIGRGESQTSTQSSIRGRGRAAGLGTGRGSGATGATGRGRGRGRATTNLASGATGSARATAVATARGRGRATARARATASENATATASANATATTAGNANGVGRGGRPPSRGLDGIQLWDRYIYH